MPGLEDAVKVDSAMNDFATAGPTAKRLEDAGYDGGFTFEGPHDPFFPLVVASQATERLELYTAIAIAFSRNPMILANIGWDLQALSKGRFMLGLGSQIKPHIEKRFSMPWSKPAARMREMVLAIKEIWRCWAEEDRLDFRGEFYQHTLMTPIFSPGRNEFGNPPIFVAGVGPVMTEAAAEAADGFFVHPFGTAKSMAEVTLHNIAVPGAETNDSLIVWLPDERIVFTGNLFGCPFGHFPNLVTIRGDRYRDALTCAGAVETVRDLEPEVILYGHHDPVVGAELIRRELDALHAAIHHVHDAVVKGMNDGKDLETLQQEITLPPECEVGEGYGTVAWSIRAIWENYAGWFKHESTTELYDVPRRTIDVDLVELAGADALVARAEKKATAGAREEALHLLDIVLSAEPDHAPARSLSIEVHESLLEDARRFRTTGNFWLEGWLENQIKRLSGGREESLGAMIR